MIWTDLPDDAAELTQIRTALKRQGFGLLRYDDGPVHSYPYDAPWLTDREFTTVYERIRHNTLVDRPRCYALYLLAQQVRGIEGDVLEVGSWRGGTAALLGTSLPDKRLYVADTFQGVVKSSDWEHYRDAAHADTSRATVEGLLDGAGVQNYNILQGIFPDETGDELDTGALALVYLDLDVYRSTRDAFDFVWDRVTVGGLVVFDDYGMISACEGISRFVDSVRDDADKLFVPNLNGQAYLVKTS